MFQASVIVQNIESVPFSFWSFTVFAILISSTSSKPALFGVGSFPVRSGLQSRNESPSSLFCPCSGSPRRRIVPAFYQPGFWNVPSLFCSS